MREIKIKLNLMEWYITPEIGKNRGSKEFKFLCVSIQFLNNKKNGR